MSENKVQALGCPIITIEFHPFFSASRIFCLSPDFLANINPICLAASKSPNFDLDLKFILTYSVTISGLIGPVFKLVSGEIPTLSNENISLITAGTILTFYYSNTELLHKILILIRNNNLINEFNKITGVPIVLNTSFNENEPIVLTPNHAFDCFRRTSMDCLVLENWIITRE